MLPNLEALFQKFVSLLAIAPLPATFAPRAHALAAPQTIEAPPSTIASTSLISQTGSFSSVLRIQSHEPYLSFRIPLHSSVIARSFSITIVSSGFVNHLAVADAVFKNEPGTFFIAVHALKLSSSPSSKSVTCSCTQSSIFSKKSHTGLSEFRNVPPTGWFIWNHSHLYHHP